MGTAESPLVSVVLPVYNGAVTISRTIDSVLGQSHQHFELLIINDGSTDSTPEMLAQFDDPRIAVHSFENRGLAASRNRGIRLARGEYVAFIDADDLWKPRKLEKQIAALQGNPEAGLAYSLTDCIDEHDNFLGHGSHIVDSGNVYDHLLTWNFLDNGSTPLIRRSVMEEIGSFDETLAAAEDWDVWLRIAHRYEFACVPEVQVLYRIHGGAMSSKLAQQEAACFRVFDQAIERLPDGERRRRLDRQGRATLNRYFADRLLATAPDTRSIRPVFRYLVRWFRLANDRAEILGKVISQTIKAVVLSVLPHRVARPLITRLEHLRRKH